MIAAACLIGCGTIMNSHVHHMNDQELQLRRYQLAFSTSRGAWGNAYDDLQDDVREKEAIERELMHRGLINPSNLPQRLSPRPELVY